MTDEDGSFSISKDYTYCDKEVINQFGLIGAILINHFFNWLKYNKERNIQIKDGRTWTYQTYAYIQKSLNFLTVRQVGHEMRKLVAKGVFITSNVNEKANDNTTWYAFKNEEMLDLFIDGIISKNNKINGDTKSGLGGTKSGPPKTNAGDTDMYAHGDTDMYAHQRAATIYKYNKEINISNTQKKLNQSKSVYGEMKNVFLTDDEYLKLVERFTEEEVIKLIEDVDLYIAKKGINYKSHYAVILTWKRNENKYNSSCITNPSIADNRQSQDNVTNPPNTEYLEHKKIWDWYNEWRDKLTSPYIMNKPYMFLDENGFFLETTGKICKYKLNIEKFKDLLRSICGVPNQIITGEFKNIKI